MKLNNKQPIFRILSLALLFCLLFTACTPQVSPSGTDSGISSNQTSSSTSQASSSKTSQTLFSFGYDIQFPGALIREMEGVDVLVREFDYAGGELKANLYFRNELEGMTELGLLIFCEGVPMEYTLLDSGETGFFHVFQVEGEKTVKVSLNPDFDLNLGRIDFHVVPLPNEKEYQMPNDVMVFHASLPEGYRAEDTYSDVIGDVENAQIIAMPENLKSTKSTGAHMLVVNSASEMTGFGPRMHEIAGKETTRIVVYVPAPGTYRLVFLLDGEPIVLAGEKTVLNCEFGEDEMFSIQAPLKELVPSGEHILQAVATRVDEKTYATRQSCELLSSHRVKIIN